LKIRYTRRALRQLSEVLEYIAERSPKGAQSVQARLSAAIERLAEHPLSGAATGKGDLRRIVANPYPYLTFYAVGRESVTIHRIRHAARADLTRQRE